MRSSFWRAAFVAAFAVGLFAAPLAQAQNPSGEIGGTVTDGDGAALPGVTVTATSPNLQGSRVAVTGQNGTYKLAFLPPGEYTVTYELEGFATQTRQARVAAALNNRIDIELGLAAVTEEIVVTGEGSTISESTTGASSYTQDEIEQLPIQRDLDSAVLLAPGTLVNPGTGGVQIAGAMSFENLWTLNGVVLNENVRGQELPLFIEDAIQETTTQVSGISAEYGRFAGGVVNAITKSGGNEFTGSFRTSFTNDDWTSENTPEEFQPTRADEINETFEATLGGYLWKDHIWFFGAGRDVETEAGATLPVTNFDVQQTNEQQRWEGKLTGTIADNHTLIGSYLEIDQLATGTFFSGNIDPNAVTDREDPQDLFSVNYTGILTPSFFVEAQYSERHFDISVGGGAQSRELIPGTLMRSQTSGARYFSATFCGVCETEERDNENILAKGSYFLSTDAIGTHDISFGVDQFSDIRFAINHQTGSDFTVWDTEFNIIGDDIFPTFQPCAPGAAGCEVTTGDNPSADDAWIGWWAVFNPDQAQHTDFKTNSLYVNDRWQLNENWSFNVGVRYDENDGENSGGVVTADDSKISPRLGANWDVAGDGDLVLHASYGTYVAALANTIGDQSTSGGAIGLFLSRYGGPAVNLDCGEGGECLPTAEALEILYNWYFANGGTTDINGNLSGIPNLISVSWPGLTATVPDTINSQAADEAAIGATKRLGNRGLLRGDVVHRDFEDFYSNLVIGRGADVPFIGQQDLSLVGNFGDNVLEREYLGLHLQGRYRFTDRFTFNANYTLSELEGNVIGENSTSGPLTSSPNAYPEYFETSWSFPVGLLPSDQTHKVRLWGIYDLIDTDHHNLSVSLLQRFDSGNTYSLSGAVDTNPFVPASVAAQYRTPPTTVTYFFSDRGDFRFDDITATDLSLNYSFLWDAFGRQVEVYLQPEVLNAFNEDGLIAFETRVRTASSNNAVGACPNSGLANGACIPFNPFTETPVEGVHWAKWTHPTLPDFGEPRSDDDFQAPRTYRFSVGFRF
ncbi:MAG TPA: TonB-dependent receptor [Thermoanaerobaculia bacterium]|nr:TonB-dependent receptor [Thermoanaerobaculia bacterium]